MENQGKQRLTLRKSISLSLLSILTLLSVLSCQRESLVPSDLPREEAIEAGAADNQKENTVYYNYLTGEVSSVELATLRPVCFFLDSADAPRGLSCAKILIELSNTSETGTKMAVITNDCNRGESIGEISSTTAALHSLSGAFSPVGIYNESEDTLEGGQDAFDAKSTTAAVFFREGSGERSYLMSSPALAIGAVMTSGYAGTVNETFAMPYRINSTSPTAGAAAGKYISIPYCDNLTVNFMYDSQLGEYRRMQNDKIYRDGDGLEIRHKNIIILTANTTTVASADGTYMSIDAKSGGEGYYLYGGAATPIRWTRSGSHLSLTKADGSPLEVAVGNTYIGVLQISRKNSLIIGN